MKARNKLVRNDSLKEHIQNLTLTLNLLPKLVRHDKMEDRDFLVIPMVILTEGVHTGSDGPMFYPKEELSKTPAAWNHKPVVVYHPEMNGVGISACDPSIISNRKVGVMMNTKFEKGKLKSEAWIEVTRANKVDERIMAAIEANQMMELSTGVFVDMEAEDGEWKGENYTAIARNYRPDHLALLPDKIGACSIKDGAGFLRNQDGTLNPVFVSLQKRMQDLMKDLDAIGNQDPNKNQNKDKRMNKKELVDSIITANAGYKEENRTALMELTEAQLETMVNLHKEFPTVNFTMEKGSDGKASLLLKQEKAAAPPTLLMMPKAGESKADFMARCTAGGVNDKPACNLMYDKMQKNEEPKEEPKKKDEPKTLNLQEYIAAAPPEVQAVLNNSIAVYDEEKARLIESIIANKNNPFPKEDLANRPLGELRGLARLAGVAAASSRPQAHYGGQAAVPTDHAEAEEPMGVPVLNFAKS